MSGALNAFVGCHPAIVSATSLPLRKYLVELAVYLERVVPRSETDRLLEEVADHFETMLEAEGHSFEEVAAEFGSSRQLADNFIEAWYAKRSSPSLLERRLGTGSMFALGTFGFASLIYWVLLQFRVFLPTYTSIKLPWSPGQIRAFFPEPLPFPDFSVQFLLLTGIPLLAPPLIGWLVGRSVHIKPHSTTYSVVVHITIVSYIIGILLLPMTDGLVFALFQTVYWLPVGCLAAYMSHTIDRKRRQKRADRIVLEPLAQGVAA